MLRLVFLSLSCLKHSFLFRLRSTLKMELCSSSATSSTFFKFKLSLSHHHPTSLPTSFNSHRFKKLLSSSIKQLTASPFRHFNKFSSPFVVASTSTQIADTRTEKLPADLKVTEFHEPNSRVRLSVEVPSVVCEDCYRRVIRECMKNAKVPGFRTGKIPEDILISYIGKQNVQKATVESILKRTLPHAMSSVTGNALEDSVRIASNFSDMEKSLSSSKTLSYEIIVDVAPEIKWNPENAYKNLKIVVEIGSEIDAQKASEKEFSRRHKSLGSLKIVIDRGLQVGDVAVLDISATTIGQDESDAERIPSAESKGFQFDTEDADQVLPGFLESIIGIQRGETKSFPYKFPETWKPENLRGVQALFTVECKELFYRQLPELNDSIAEKLLKGCSTLKEVKEVILEKCLEVEQTAKDQATDNAILDQLCKLVEIEIPRSLFEEQGRQLYGAQLLQVQANTKISEQQLAYLSSPKAVSEFLKNNEENITSVIKQNLAVGDIFQRENLQFSTEELVEEVNNSIAEFEKHKQEYDQERVKEQVQEVLEGAKVLEWLRKHAEIQYITR